VAERRITIALPDSLAGEVEQAVQRGDAATLDEFVADALRRELDRVRSEASSVVLVDEEAPPEEVGIGWEGLMPKTDESRKDSFKIDET
jgi:Arc/MetJ-type ribon-helix-helix transcriptional regulator